MLKNTLINRAATKKIAQALGELNDKAVFVGGAVVSLYIDDQSAEDVRPTQDIDIVVEISRPGQLETLREKLMQKGFYQSREDSVICRFRFEDIKVDVMSTEAVGWAPADPWFKAGFRRQQHVDVDGIHINCLPLAYYLTTKFSAFYDRGSMDPRTSQDFEDIVYLLNYISDVEDQILSSDEKVKLYLVRCFMDVLYDKAKQEAILGSLFYEDQQRRFEKNIKKLETICQAME